jgi:predicted NUDIX family phosphoesterase
MMSKLGERGGRMLASDMSKYAGEQVLVVPREILNQLGAFEGIRSEGVDGAMDVLLSESSHFFMDRAAAEEDPSHKQLIPYCVFRCGNRILHYTRGKAGGESRLHAKISVGVGGHINPIDSDGGNVGAPMYHAAVARELAEELDLPELPKSRMIALLNDESNAVGQVHLGVVHLIDLPSEQVASREDALLDLRFSSLEELNGPLFERLETWSAFCIRYLAEHPGV